MWSAERLWCGFVPVIIHLIARGLQQSLFGMAYLFVKSIQWCLGRLLRPISWGLLLVSMPCSLVCSGLGMLCMLLSFLMQVGCKLDDPLPTLFFFFFFSKFDSHILLIFQVSSRRTLGVACVLVCLQILLVPTLISWAKGLR